MLHFVILVFNTLKALAHHVIYFKVAKNVANPRQCGQNCPSNFKIVHVSFNRIAKDSDNNFKNLY